MTPREPAASNECPLVLIHGVSDTHSSWDDVVAELGPERRIITYDLRGHGSAPTRPLVTGIDDFVDDMVDLLDERGVITADIAGFSLGALIAQRFAIREPGRLRNLIVIGAVAGRSAAEQQAVLDRLHDIETLGPVEVAETSIQRWFTPEYLVQHPEAGTDVIERMAAMDRDAYTAAYRVLATTDLADQLHEIRAPTLAIAGENDIGSPPHMSELIAERTGGRVVVLPGVKHNILHEAATSTAKEITAHVN